MRHLGKDRPTSKNPKSLYVQTAINTLSLAAVLAVFLLLFEPYGNVTWYHAWFGAAAIATLAAAGLALAVRLLLVRDQADLPTTLSDTTPPDTSPDADATSPALDRARRSARRLNAVEEELIRRIYDSYRMDKQTHRLLTEMRICSNRVMRQIEECSDGAAAIDTRAPEHAAGNSREELAHYV